MICLGNVRLVKNVRCLNMPQRVACKPAMSRAVSLNNALFIPSFYVGNPPTTIRCYVTVDMISLHLLLCGGMRNVKSQNHSLDNQIPSLDWLPDHSERGLLVGFRNEGYRSNEMSSLSTLHWERNSGCLSGWIFHRFSHGIKLNAVHVGIES